MKTGTLLGILGVTGLLAYFATRKAKAATSVMTWCAGPQEGRCDITGASPEEAASNWAAGQPVSGAEVARDPATTPNGSQIWHLMAPGMAPISFFVWRQ